MFGRAALVFFISSAARHSKLGIKKQNTRRMKMKNLFKNATLTATTLMTFAAQAGEQRFPEYGLDCTISEMPKTIDPNYPVFPEPVKATALIQTRAATRDDNIEDKKLLGKPYDNSSIRLEDKGIEMKWLIVADRPSLQIRFDNGVVASDAFNNKVSYLSLSQNGIQVSCFLKRLGR